jgi:hypothetical protein
MKVFRIVISKQYIRTLFFFRGDISYHR